ncbi:MAG: preprotein translocase subunit SecE [Deltaproteobacteria bacterium]|nr:preprotein translocase subunit SecE [Deltaproteobacteria bacterium]MBW2072110.1 preprotein translocase subunit SecE [Deltaproteobacteria bacterium]
MAKKGKKRSARRNSAVSAKARGSSADSSARVRKDAARKSKSPQKDGVSARTAGIVKQAGQFVREAKVELTKVTWPSRKETIASTSVVLVIVFLIGAFLGLVDLGLSRILKMVLS